jgi:hypothetical protein
VQKAERDELVSLAMNDPVMTAAIHHARKSLPQFWPWQGTQARA